MGFSLKKLKKIGRAIDPTSKKSVLGGVTRTAIGFVPGGAAALGAVGTVKAVTGGGGGKKTPKADATAATAPEAAAATSTGGASLGSTWSSFATKPWVVAAAGVVAVLLLLTLRKR